MLNVPLQCGTTAITRALTFWVSKVLPPLASWCVALHMSGHLLHNIVADEACNGGAGQPGLLLLDISGGKENRCIPVFNTVDGDQAPSDLHYIRYGTRACCGVPPDDARLPLSSMSNSQALFQT